MISSYTRSITKGPLNSFASQAMLVSQPFSVKLKQNSDTESFEVLGLKAVFHSNLYSMLPAPIKKFNVKTLSTGLVVLFVCNLHIVRVKQMFPTLNMPSKKAGVTNKLN